MSDKISNFLFPVSGGAIGGTTPLWLGWHQVGDVALTAAIMAFVGAVIGLVVKLCWEQLRKKFF